MSNCPALPGNWTSHEMYPIGILAANPVAESRQRANPTRIALFNFCIMLPPCLIALLNTHSILSLGFEIESTHKLPADRMQKDSHSSSAEVKEKNDRDKFIEIR